MLLQVFELSTTGPPVKSHLAFATKFSDSFYQWLGHSRGFYCNERAGVIKITTVSFIDPTASGSVEITLEKSLVYSGNVMRPSFDEETGRILISAKKPNGEVVDLVYDIV
jgi:hypothetical protein